MENVHGVQLDGDEESKLDSVLQCAQEFAAATFTQPDDDLFEASSARSAHRGIVELMTPFRGIPKIASKGERHAAAVQSSSDCAVFVQPALFPKYRAPTARFFSSFASLPGPTDLPKCSTMPVDVMKEKQQQLAVRVERVVKHPVTQGCMKQCGCVMARPTVERWNLHWGARLKEDSAFSQAYAFQRINHFPGTWVLGRKDALARQLRLSSQRKGMSSHFAFAPFTYSWPIDQPILQRDMAQGMIFIVKPPAGARGEGISLFRDSIPQFLIEAAQSKRAQQQQDTPAAAERKASTAFAKGAATKTAGDSSSEDENENDDESDEEDREWIIQRYIPNPLTINGYKVDLRVYAVCTSFDPLRLYVYNEGLVRFATHPYPKNLSTAPLDNVFCHLTNYSVNKNNKGYKESTSAEDEGSGSKWTLHGLKRYFESQGWNWERAWKDIQGVIVKSFIAVESTVCAKSSMIRHRHTCFELYGFDIMLTDRFEAQLIEVNVMPSLATGSALDKHVKGHLIADMLTLVGLPIVNAAACVARDDEQRQARRTGIPVEGDAPGASAVSGNNIECKPTKYDAKKFESKKYFELHATEDDKAMIRDTEEEYSRRGGFHRVFPTPTSSIEFGPLFEINRHYNFVLSEWEAVKLKFTEPQRTLAVAWLNNEGTFPLAQLPKKKPKTAEAPPRCASLPARPRVSATPKDVTQKTPILPPIQKQAIPVCVFTFIQVHK